MTRKQKVQKISATPRTQDRNDRHILQLFRQWREAVSIANSQTPAIDEEAQPAHDRVYALERLIYDTPASSAAGLAIKAYMVANDGVGEDSGLMPFDPEDSYAPDGTLQLDKHAVKGLIEDAVRFAPELAPLAAGVINIPSRLAPDERQQGELRAAVEALAAEYAAPLPEGDAGLIEAERRYRELDARCKAINKEFHITIKLENEIYLPIIDPPRNRLIDYIERTPPQTLAGATAKLRLLTGPEFGITEGEINDGETVSLLQVAGLVENLAKASDHANSLLLSTARLLSRAQEDEEAAENAALKDEANRNMPELFFDRQA